ALLVMEDAVERGHPRVRRCAIAHGEGSEAAGAVIIIPREHAHLGLVMPARRMLRPLAGRAQVADADDAEPGEPRDVALGQIGHRAGAEDHAAADAAAVGRRIAAEITEIMAPLQRKDTVVDVVHDGFFAALSAVTGFGLGGAVAGGGLGAAVM